MEKIIFLVKIIAQEKKSLHFGIKEKINIISKKKQIKKMK